MIRKHVDVWAILLLLFVFAMFTRADSALIRIVRAKLTFSDRVYPMEVHISPWRLNHFHSISSRPAGPPCRMI